MPLPLECMRPMVAALRVTGQLRAGRRQRPLLLTLLAPPTRWLQRLACERDQHAGLSGRVRTSATTSKNEKEGMCEGRAAPQGGLSGGAA